MGQSSPSVARIVRFLAAAGVLTIACKETTAPPVPTKLAFLTVQPASTIANTAILPAVKVAIQDADGNVLTSATNSITLSFGTNPTQGRLLGNTTIAAIDGVATFSDISIDKTGSGFTLTASSPNLSSATTSPFSVGTGPAAKLVFTNQPVTTLARTSIPPFTVSVQDAAGNNVPSIGINIGVRIGFNPGGGVLSGITQRATDITGSARFSNLTISNPGTGYTLTAFPLVAGSSIATGNSNPFDQIVGAAARIAFTTQPVLTRPGEVIPPVVAVVQDSVGNIVRTATGSMTISIGANSGNATLAGTTTMAVVNGVATFSDLKINNVGTGYTLVAAAPGVASGTSNSFSVRNPLTFAAVSAGYFHSCGLTTSGDAFCWGSNGVGQTGDGTTHPTVAPEPVAGGLKFTTVTAGRDHNCAVTVAGIAYCWGSNEEGQLGSVGSLSRAPTVVSGGLTFGGVTAGYSHTCGLTPPGAVYCWGDNSLGALGNGTFISGNVPAAISGLSLSMVSTGRLFTCGVTAARVAYCWGDNSSGFLGDGTVTRRSSPVIVSGQLEFVTIGAGGFHACGLTVAGRAYCWGLNGSGQVGNASTISTPVPVAVAGGLTFTALSVGNRHACALTSAGAAYCWGDNTNGNLGNGLSTNSTVPVAVSGGLTFASVSAGRFHTCGVTTSGAAYCWGENSSNQLGDGTEIARLVPAAVR